jgi:hypothetical protein
MMAAQLREGEGLGQALKTEAMKTEALMNSLSPTGSPPAAIEGKKEEELVLVNKAGESKSPYVRAHAGNPVQWQLWGDEAIELARKENRLLFVSIGYSACHCRSFSPSCGGMAV